jgi:hypothetical protein
MNPHPTVSDDVHSAFLDCRYKGHLERAGRSGTRSDYEALMAEQRAAIRRRTLGQITDRHADGEVHRNAPLTTPTLERGAAFVLDATLEGDTLSLRLDGLKKVAGPSKLVDCRYVPLLFPGGGSVREEQRQLLDVLGFLLSRSGAGARPRGGLARPGVPAHESPAQPRPQGRAPPRGQGTVSPRRRSTG